jgi:hypothetical protein
MSRHAGMVCAGALLCAAAGCSLEAFLVSIPGPVGKSRSLVGSVDEVSANLQTMLGNAGITMIETRQRREVRLTGVTRSGVEFALLLHQQYSTGRPRTLVTVEWKDGPDAEFWEMFVEMLASPQGAPNGPSPNALAPNGPAPAPTPQPEKPVQAGI